MHTAVHLRGTTTTIPARRRKLTTNAQKPPVDMKAYAAECLQNEQALVAKSETYKSFRAGKADLLRSILEVAGAYRTRDIAGDPDYAFYITNCREQFKLLADQLNPNDLCALAQILPSLLIETPCAEFYEQIRINGLVPVWGDQMEYQP